MNPEIPAIALTDTHAARDVVHAFYTACSARDFAALLPLVHRPALDTWYASLLRTPREVWTLQERRDLESMPVKELPEAVEDGLRYVLEAIPEEDLLRVPRIRQVRAGESGQVGVHVTLQVPETDPTASVSAPRSFVVDVQFNPDDNTWQVVPPRDGAFPFPGFGWGVLVVRLPTGPDAVDLPLEIRVEPSSDPTNAAALEQWLQVCGCQVRARDTWPAGWRALAVVVPAATVAIHGATFIHAVCDFAVVRQVWRAQER